MERSKVAAKMIKLLENKIYCGNVLRFVDETISTKIDESPNIKIYKLKIESVPVTVQILKYNDTDDENTEDDPEKKRNKKWVEKKFKVYDFITDANYTGFEYFPYIYGVLNCHDGENSRLYVFYEFFEGNLVDLVNNIGHPSEWYDIVFQFIIINNYIQMINNYSYKVSLKNFLYKKLQKPIYQLYNFGEYQFNIKHQYLVVLWGIDEMEPITENSTNNISLLLKFIDENKDNIKVPASGRIIKLLTDVIENPNKTIDILNQYYNTN